MKIIRSTRYLLPFVVAALLLVVEGYTLSVSDFFVKHLLFGQNMMQVDEIKFTAETEHIDADIVFIGDSTSMFGIIPSVVERATGLKTYNLGVTIDAFACGEAFLLTHYLQHNHPPKYIVLHINPLTQVSHYDTTWFGRKEGGTPWECTWITVRHGSLRDIAATFARHPAHFIKFPLSALRLSGLAIANHFGPHIADFENTRAMLAANAGFVPLSGNINKQNRLADGCHIAKYVLRPDSEYIESFRRRYSTVDTTALVFIAPIPDCDESLESFLHAYSGLVDLQPRAMPHRYFQDLKYSSHLFPSGAEVNSQAAGSFIRELILRRGP